MHEKPDHFILHKGTSDLNSEKSSELIVKSIADVGSSLKSESRDASISSITIRNDKFKKGTN